MPTKIKCNLCKQEFPNDELISRRKERHEEFHQYNGYKQNKVLGIVSWSKI